MKTKVLIFIDIFGCGGIEKFISMICTYLDRTSLDIEVLSVIKDDNSYYLRQLDEMGVKVISLLESFETDPVKRMKFGHKAFKKYLDNVDKKTVIHFNVSNSLDIKYAMIAYHCGFNNIILHSHNSDATSKVKRLAHYIFKPINRIPGSVNLACSKKAAIWLYSKEDILKENFTIINNAIDAKNYSFNIDLRLNKREELGLTNALVIGHVGRYNVQKNHMFLIDVFKEVHNINSKAHLLLIGDGDLRECVEKRIKELNLERNVTMIKQTNSVNEYLQAMDVFVLPSLYEGLPFVLVESQAAGLPSVVSDTITHEIEITDYIRYIPIDSSKNWARQVILASEQHRSDTYLEIKKTGFDIIESIKQIEKVYKKCANMEGNS